MKKNDEITRFQFVWPTQFLSRHAPTHRDTFYISVVQEPSKRFTKSSTVPYIYIYILIIYRRARKWSLLNCGRRSFRIIAYFQEGTRPRIVALTLRRESRIFQRWILITPRYFQKPICLRGWIQRTVVALATKHTPLSYLRHCAFLTEIVDTNAVRTHSV